MQLVAPAKAMAARVGPALPGVLRELTALGGLAGVAFGAWQISHGAGFIVGGLELVLLAFLNTPLPKPPSIGEGEPK